METLENPKRSGAWTWDTPASMTGERCTRARPLLASQNSRVHDIYHPNEKFVRKLQHTMIVKFIMQFLFEGHNKALIGTGAAFLQMRAR